MSSKRTLALLVILGVVYFIDSFMFAAESTEKLNSISSAGAFQHP